MAEMTDEEKQRELYKASLPAFFMNEIETDKIILTLSVGAIGFYSALLINKDLMLTETMFISMIISVVLYGVAVAMVIGVFLQNKKQLLSIISTNGIGKEDQHLSFLDSHKYKPFIGAIVFSIVFMLALIYEKVNKSDIKINNQSKEHVVGLHGSNEGFDEIVNINSNNKGTKVMNGYTVVVDTNSSSNDNNLSKTNKSK